MRDRGAGELLSDQVQSVTVLRARNRKVGYSSERFRGLLNMPGLVIPARFRGHLPVSCAFVRQFRRKFPATECQKLCNRARTVNSVTFGDRGGSPFPTPNCHCFRGM